jgi:predicted DNA-binding transcriptional regulator AlpA
MALVAESFERPAVEQAADAVDGDVVYDELPEGLIDLPSAMRKYSLKRPTLWSWVSKGHLQSYGRLRGSATGGGLILVNEEDLVRYMHAPKPKGGRPRKSIETR